MTKDSILRKEEIKKLENEIFALTKKKDDLRIINPWYPVNGISARISGNKRKIKRIRFYESTRQIKGGLYV